MKESPFAHKSSVSVPAVPIETQQPQNALTVRQSAFAVQQAKALPVVRWTSDDIDRVGRDPQQHLSQLTDRVTKKMTLNRLGDLGELLQGVEREVQNLNPGNLKKDGVLGWFSNHFADIRKELTMRFQTADTAFDKLLKAMGEHVSKLTEWEKDDEHMYTENWERFKEIQASLREIELIRDELRAAIGAWPVVDPNDPEAMMKVQQKLVLEDLSNRASVRRDALMRSKVKCETNAPEILAMKSVSGKLVAKINSDANDVLPEIKREIAKQIQRLDMMQGTTAVKSFGAFANAVLKKGAQSTKEAVLEGNKAFNESTISLDTITTMQTNVRDMVVGIQSITVEAEKRRIAEEQQIDTQQKQLLKDIQGKAL